MLHRSLVRLRSSPGTPEAYPSSATPVFDGSSSPPYRAAVTEARVAVLASGGGTNLQALLDDPVVGPWVVLVVSDRERAPALERARARGVEAVFLDPRSHVDRAAFDRAILDLLQERAIGAVALAGFLRIVGPELVDAFPDRMLNVHPALLPAFPGTTSVADALAWGVKVTGVTVHLVDAEVDHGPIVFQEALPVLADDDWDALEARVHAVEHRLLPAAVRALVENRIRVEGRTTRVLEEAPA
jgi:phosphoribosylglycinamide formyltransferase-1